MKATFFLILFCLFGLFNTSNAQEPTFPDSILEFDSGVVVMAGFKGKIYYADFDVSDIDEAENLLNSEIEIPGLNWSRLVKKVYYPILDNIHDELSADELWDKSFKQPIFIGCWIIFADTDDEFVWAIDGEIDYDEFLAETEVLKTDPQVSKFQSPPKFKAKTLKPAKKLYGFGVERDIIRGGDYRYTATGYGAFFNFTVSEKEKLAFGFFSKSNVVSFSARWGTGQVGSEYFTSQDGNLPLPTDVQFDYWSTGCSFVRQHSMNLKWLSVNFNWAGVGVSYHHDNYGSVIGVDNALYLDLTFLYGTLSIPISERSDNERALVQAGLGVKMTVNLNEFF